MSIRKSFGATLTTTPTAVYTAPPSKKAEWVHAYITNVSGSNGTIDMSVNGFVLLNDYAVSAKDFLDIGGTSNSFVILEAGQTITASATQSMTLVVSILEYNDIIQGG
jgi:hypothetical protein